MTSHCIKSGAAFKVADGNDHRKTAMTLELQLRSSSYGARALPAGFFGDVDLGLDPAIEADGERHSSFDRRKNCVRHPLLWLDRDPNRRRRSGRARLERRTENFAVWRLQCHSGYFAMVITICDLERCATLYAMTCLGSYGSSRRSRASDTIETLLSPRAGRGPEQNSQRGIFSNADFVESRAGSHLAVLVDFVRRTVSSGSFWLGHLWEANIRN